ncbi:MAG TPA: phenylalanine--tRNA ligase subunit beta [Bacteroidota bacterium]|nr:phenylalanine--tRNA ligase subunit beta [Bacteroidota bacterium]
MRISLQWLKSYVDVDASPEEIAQKLTSAGLEVESVENLGQKFDKFVVGYVKNVVKHPKADKLSLCDVAISETETIRVVCGAPNVAAGQKVPVALVGALIPSNLHDPEGKPFVIAKAKIRGEESNGMICAESELQLSDNADGIMVLKDTARVGTPLAEYLGLDDVAFEIGVTPNRPDCLGHIGLAREVASAYGVELKLPDAPIVEKQDDPVSAAATVKIENTTDCPRYAARIVRNVTIGPSPTWMQDRLTVAGVRPINAIVDVTNYVMLEYNQPLHAFDYDKLGDRTIVVKTAQPGEKFTTLDGKERSLPDAALMICDATRPVAVAGVMGGLNSEISTETTAVLLESAYFNPVSVRKTSKHLGLSTDASYRFERGIDPSATVDALNRAASLIAEIAGGTVCAGVIDVYPSPIAPKQVGVRPSRVNQVLGTSITRDQMMKFLRSIDIRINDRSAAADSARTQGGVITDDEPIACVIPTFRPDIEQEIDLVEEVARLHGFTNIEDKMVSEIDFSNKHVTVPASDRVREWLVGAGFNEIVSNSLLDESIAAVFSDKLVRLLNPISKEQSVMRPNLLVSMLQTVVHNSKYGTENLRVFELGRGFEVADAAENGMPIRGFRERNLAGICLTGKAAASSWYGPERPFDLFDMKGIVHSLLDKIALDKFAFIYYDAQDALTEQRVGIEINGVDAGYFGKVNSAICKKLKIENDVFIAELKIDALEERERAFRQYVPVLKYPVVGRDIAFIVEKDTTSASIEETIRTSGGMLLRSVELFDLFEGKSVGEGKKSVAYSLRFASPERTLTDAEIEKAMNAVIAAVTQQHHATVRAMEMR